MMIFEDGELLPNTVIYGIGFGRLEVSPSTAEVMLFITSEEFDDEGSKRVTLKPGDIEHLAEVARTIAQSLKRKKPDILG
jgi:hypothetical protein